MNKTIAKFEKVSYEQFKKDFIECSGIPLKRVVLNDKYEKVLTDIYSEEELNKLIKNIYDNIKLPKRATSGSAGYDFYSVIDFALAPGKTIKLPTGIRCSMNSDVVLMLYPRSGLGFKYRMQLNNTVGVIDSDYYGAKNEGHIMAKITNDSNEDKTIEIKMGDGFIQGIFTKYYLAEEETVTTERTGGFGSTSK